MEWREGAIRIQALGPYLVRVEEQGPGGFEDRPSFTVERRVPTPIAADVRRDSGGILIETPHYGIQVKSGAQQLAEVVIETRPDGSRAAVEPKDWPEPSSLPKAWILRDAPRIVPPRQGALPPPAGEADLTSGWDLNKDAPDVYIFFPVAAGYEEFRADFLALTGAIPLVPLYTLGLWYSRYHPYDAATALAVIDRFRQRGFPLDLFTLDTDWREGGSSGYVVNRKLFPDLKGFIQQAHARHVRVMLNDHPEPRGRSAVDPEELRYRYTGLTALLAQGADIWWYDRNWHTHLPIPAPALPREVWGMRLYWEITRSFYPDRRPLILSNADGIHHGRRERPAHPAAHRYPVWWTGDTLAEWRYLEWGVRNAVDSGIRGLMPYVHEDLGGHHGHPDEELYTRFMQFGAFSPVARIHCTQGVQRYPWARDERVERIVREYFRWRYRLLPLLYAAAHAAHRRGMPLLRRCDLYWPACPEAADSSQYLLGEDWLVAPIVAPSGKDGISRRPVWIPPGEWLEIGTGKTWRGPVTMEAACPLEEYPLFVRRGGIVWLLPLRYWTGEAVWPELTADVFVPQEEGTWIRELYEDDGRSLAYLDGACAKTEFRQVSGKKEVSLAIIPEPAPPGVRSEQRRLTARFYLPGRQTGAEWQFRAPVTGHGWTCRRIETVHIPLDWPALGADASPRTCQSVVEFTAAIPTDQPVEFRLIRR